MSVDIKEVAEAIKKAGDNSEELEKVFKQYEEKFNSLSEKAKIADEVSEKGIFKQLKEAQAELDAIKKAKEDAEEKELIEKGKNKELAEKYRLEKEKLEGELSEKSKIADQWTNYEKSRRETLMSKLTPEQKAIAEQMASLEAIEKFVDMVTDTKFSDGGGNRQHKKKDGEEKPIIEYTTMN